MSLFISLFGGGAVGSTTSGATSGAGGGSSAGSMIMLLVMIVAIFLIMIIPQRRKDKQKKNLLSSIKKGDKVETIGGIRGTVVAVKEQTVVVKVEGDAKIEFVKEAIANVLNRKPEDLKAQKGKKGKADEAPVNITPVRKGEQKDEDSSSEDESEDNSENEDSNEETK